MLGRDVGRLQRDGLDGECAGDVDDAALALGAHLVQGGLHPVDLAEEDHLDGPGDLFGAQLVDLAVDRGGRAVDPGVDAPEPLGGLAGQPLDLRPLRHIGGADERRAAEPGHFGFQRA
nr:hypothetical protein [Modestobacter caceresii]